MGLGMDKKSKSKSKSKSKNLDCEYAYKKVRKNRMSQKRSTAISAILTSASPCDACL